MLSLDKIGESIAKSVEAHLGWPGVIIMGLLAAAFLLWKNWDSVRTRPGVTQLLQIISRKPILRASPRKFTIGIFRLVNDPGNRERGALEAAVRATAPDYVSLQLVDREISAKSMDLAEGNGRGHAAVRQLLGEHGYHGALWGEVTQRDGKSIPILHWTTLAENTRVKDSEHYVMRPDGIELPALFWKDLGTVLAVVVEEQAALAAPHGKIPDWKRYEALINRLRELTRSKGPNWAAEDRAYTLNVLSNSVRTAGEMRGNAGHLSEAVTLLRDLVKEFTREQAPMVWALTQNNLGNALRTLGERTGQTGQLEEAVSAFRSALQEYTRERSPMAWAATKNNLGNALQTLGERTGQIEQLEEAVSAFRSALQEYTRERSPMAWAATQNNLGVALRTLGERTGQAEQLEEAVSAFRSALQERTRERAPMDCTRPGISPCGRGETRSQSRQWAETMRSGSSRDEAASALASSTVWPGCQFQGSSSSISRMSVVGRRCRTSLK